jgi:hypothetical protein
VGAFDPLFAHQLEGNGICEPLRDTHKAFAIVNVEWQLIESQEDIAERPGDVPWYYPLEGTPAIACRSRHPQ